MSSASDNAEKVAVVTESIGSFLFASRQIVSLCETTPSVKTKHALLGLLIPRCTDPNEGGAAILEMFRFTDDKNYAAEALKVSSSESWLK